MASFWRLVKKVIRDADIIMLVLDARFPELTRNEEIEEKVEEQDKQLLYVLNKCDLVSEEKIEELSKRYRPSVFVSTKSKLGSTVLYKKIMKISQGEDCVVGVVGYPNVGKSSVINMLKGRSSASTSSDAGHTRAIKLIKARKKISLLDTPGVLEFQEKDRLKQITIGAYNPHSLKDPEYYAMQLIEINPKIFEEYYDEIYENDPYDFLEKITLKKNIIMGGGKPDLKRMSKTLLYDWQRGKIHTFLIKK